MNRTLADVRNIAEPPWLENAARFATRAMDAAGLSDWDLSLLFCDEAFIAELNLEYRGKEGPTDVLSFGLGEWVDGENGRRYIAGDVVLCPSVMAANAADFGVSEDEELRRLVLHGILHLSGLDHETNEASEPMLMRQESLLATLSEETIF